MKKFFAVIGNPPYQEETKDTSDNPIYHRFMDESYQVGENAEFITPARFLFNAGKTPKAWNRKMLDDPQLKVLFYDPNPKFFQSVELKGGVVITLHSILQDFGAIGLFVKDASMSSIVHKVSLLTTNYLTEIGYSQNSFKFTELLYVDHPEFEGKLSRGHRLDLKSNVFTSLPEVFFVNRPDDSSDYDSVLGLIHNHRVYRYVKRGYICNNAKSENLDKYKVAMSKATGSGEFGEALSEIVIVPPHVGMTETFISFGNFDTEEEARGLAKYIKTKFARSILGLFKVTQENTIAKYARVPLQDFTASSDIDWSRPIAEIDQQLYAKYGLDEVEIGFIESHVKEMS